MANLEEGDIISLEIELLGKKGDGIAKIDGYVIFVPETNTGDKVKVRINKVNEKFAHAEVVN